MDQTTYPIATLLAPNDRHAFCPLPNLLDGECRRCETGMYHAAHRGTLDEKHVVWFEIPEWGHHLVAVDRILLRRHQVCVQRLEPEIRRRAAHVAGKS